MNKRRGVVWGLLVAMSFSLVGCGNKVFENATVAVDNYNTVVADCNAEIAKYNEAVNLYNQANDEFQKLIDSTQAIINKGDLPYDENTLIELKNSLVTAVETKAENMENISDIESLTVTEDMDLNSLKALTEQANAEIVKFDSFEVPILPVAVDYSSISNEINEKLIAYENSVKSMQQVTAPNDEFVIARLQTIETIIEIAPVTEEHDPNGKLNKQGGYIGCIYFSDTQVDRNKLYIEAGKDNVIDIGTDGGGCVEIYSTVEEAEVRNEYLASYDGTVFASGSHYIIGTCLVRTSNELTGTQQKELTDLIFESLLKIE